MTITTSVISVPSSPIWWLDGSLASLRSGATQTAAHCPRLRKNNVAFKKKKSIILPLLLLPKLKS